jgi:hypothetical protein
MDMDSKPDAKGYEVEVQVLMAWMELSMAWVAWVAMVVPREW